MMRFIIGLAILFVPHWILAQSFFFREDNSIPVTANGKALINPWAGGLNAVQVSAMDLDKDGREDLVVYDRSSSRLSTFIATAGITGYYYKYASAYALLFPKFNNWVLLQDYNCDGHKDIFCSSGAGDVKVYKNMSASSGQLSFNLVNEALETEGFTGIINLRINSTDLPSFTDVDNDGDIDVLTFDASSGGTVEYHRNLSKEKYGHCDSLVFKKVGACWGNFVKNVKCNDFTFGIDCGNGSGMRQLHTGSTLLALDLDGDDDKDILAGGVHCPNLSMLQNSGTPLSANFTQATDTFPNAVDKVNINYFPAAFYEDVDFDGNKDLLVSHNDAYNEGNLSDYSHSLLFYKSSGASSPHFNYVKNNFLQDEMIDVGEYAYPALWDEDGDGDLDLLVGSRGKIQSDGTFYATFHLFENTGNKTTPAFTLKDENYLDMGALKYTNLKPYFFDFNKDGKADLVYCATRSDSPQTVIYYILNSGSAGNAYHKSTSKDLPITLNDFDSPCFADVDSDGDFDLLIGKASGRLEYHKNNGDNLTPSYALINSKLGGLDNSLTDKNLFPFSADLNGDGDAELLVGNKAGNLKVFPSWKNNVDETFTNSPGFLFNEKTGNYFTPNFGRETSGTTGDLNNDGTADIVLGTNGGGLLYLKNEHLINGTGDNLHPEGFRVYPNPAKEKAYVEAASEGYISLYSVVGKELSRQAVDPTHRAEISLIHLIKGMYILKFKSVRGTVSKKLLVE